MATERPVGFEYKHVECAQEPVLVDLVVNDHAKFFWELMNTQTVVSKESHIEEGKFDSDNLYSVTTTERFVAIDFRRSTTLSELQKIREIETKYFQLCASLRNLGGSPLNDYSAPDFQSLTLFDLVLPWLSPNFYLWGMKNLNIFSFRRTIREIGLLGYFWLPYGYWKSNQGDRDRQVLEFDSLKSDLQDLLESNRELLNV